MLEVTCTQLWSLPKDTIQLAHSPETLLLPPLSRHLSGTHLPNCIFWEVFPDYWIWRYLCCAGSSRRQPKTHLKVFLETYMGMERAGEETSKS